jgi:hypothetical protein
VRRVSKKYPSVKDGDIDDRASRFIRGGKKTDGHFTLRPILHNTSSPLSLPFGKKNGWQCQNVSRHQILAQPAADTIQYRCLLFFFVVDAEEFEFIPCRIFPWPHDRLHTQVHTPFTQYMLTTKCRDRELLHPCSPVPFSISPLEESETVVRRREK